MKFDDKHIIEMGFETSHAQAEPWLSILVGNGFVDTDHVIYIDMNEIEKMLVAFKAGQLEKLLSGEDDDY